MFSKFKNFLKQKGILIFSLAFLGLILPETAEAVFLWALKVFIGWVIASFISLITGLLASLAMHLTGWAAQIPLPFTELVTDDGYLTVVGVGWPIVRDFTNIFFILGFVVIGIATALRIKDYQAQKLIPVLIVIALLINFTPVILGVIVDASNIVMNFFLEGLDIGGYFEGRWSQLKAGAPRLEIGALINPLEQLGPFLTSIILIIMDIVIICIFTLFTLIFLFRYVTIWILTILSPIAFACYIFPATKGLFNAWWKHFIQWSIIGIYATFFIYLGAHLSTAMDKVMPAMMPPAGLVYGLGDLVLRLLPFIFLTLFYIIALFITLSTSAIGADNIIRAGKGVYNFAAGAAKVKAGMWWKEKWGEKWGRYQQNRETKNIKKLSAREKKLSNTLEATKDKTGFWARRKREERMQQIAQIQKKRERIQTGRREREEKNIKAFEKLPEEEMVMALKYASLRGEAPVERSFDILNAAANRGSLSEDLIEKIGPDKIANLLRVAKNEHNLDTTQIIQAIPPQYHDRLGISKQKLSDMWERTANSPKAEFEKIFKRLHPDVFKKDENGENVLIETLRNLDEEEKLSPEFKNYITQAAAKKFGLDEIFKGKKPKIEIAGKYTEIPRKDSQKK